jgi:hypothetical protein
MKGGGRMIRPLVVGLFCLTHAVAHGAASATEARAGRTTLMFAPIVSMQPADNSRVGAPYLDRGLGGGAPGLAIGLDRRGRNGSVGLELSATMRLGTVQSGRFVYGGACYPSSVASPDCRSSRSTGRDTVLAALVGVGGKEAQVKVGVGGVLTQTVQGGEPATAAGVVAVVGCDVAGPIGRRTDLVMTFRYARAFRDDETTLYTGLGSHIFRLGVGIRLILGTSPGRSRR